MTTAVLANRVAILVQGGDAISRTGLVAQLLHRHDVRVVQADDDPAGAVTVLLVDEVDQDALRAIRAVRRNGGGRIALVVARVDDRSVLDAVEAGASTLLRRDEVTADRIVEAAQAAAAGSASMPPDLLARLLDHVGRVQRDVLGPRGLSFSVLSDREVKVLRLIADGHDTIEVGRRLFFSERTVKNILHDITSRLNLRNRTHAVAYALREGLI